MCQSYLSLSLISSSVLLMEGGGKSNSAAIRCMMKRAASSPLWGSNTPYRQLKKYIVTSHYVRQSYVTQLKPTTVHHTTCWPITARQHGGIACQPTMVIASLGQQMWQKSSAAIPVSGKLATNRSASSFCRTQSSVQLSDMLSVVKCTDIVLLLVIWIRNK